MTEALVPLWQGTHYYVCDDLWLGINETKLTSRNLDIRGLLEITKNMYSAFWNPTPTDNNLQSIIKMRNLKPDLVALCLTFTRLLFLALPDAVDTLKVDVTKLLTQGWNQHIRSHGPSLWLGESLEKSRLTELIHLFVECGVQAPFVTLYSLYWQGSLGRDVIFDRSTRSSAARHSFLCM